MEKATEFAKKLKKKKKNTIKKKAKIIKKKEKIVKIKANNRKSKEKVVESTATLFLFFMILFWCDFVALFV